MATHTDGAPLGRTASLLAVLAVLVAVDVAGSSRHVLAAQSTRRVITGTVLDARDQPVPFVSISVSSGSTKATATADDSGRFRLVVPHRDRVVFDARRVGYMPSRISLLGGGDTVVTVLLLPAAANLPALEVKDASARPAGLAGFERRMAERKRGAGAGWFITQQQIEASNPLRATQVVEAVPSVNVRRLSGDRFAIFGRTGLGQDCPATVYVDGVVVGGVSEMVVTRDRRGRAIIANAGEGAPIDMLVQPTEIAGVEVYQRGIFAPTALQPNDPNAMRCAIVAYWTKHA